ncbi:sulfur carrier protein ThiS [bacterium]|nr:sulfur carrier protein ThiS [bacterium]
MAKIKVNGEEKEFNVETLGALLTALEIKPERVAVVKNGRIVPRSERENEPVTDGDSVDIFSPVNGG